MKLRKQQFTIKWRRLGEWYTFQQTVSARSIDEARQVAVDEVKEALGDNRHEWAISRVEEAPEGGGSNSGHAEANRVP